MNDAAPVLWIQLRDFGLAVIWLTIIAALNQSDNFEIVSILPYLAPVALITMREGMVCGFVFSALGAIAAVPGNYMSNHNMYDFYWAIFTTYFKLSCAATGIDIGRKIANQK